MEKRRFSAEALVLPPFLRSSVLYLIKATAMVIFFVEILCVFDWFYMCHAQISHYNHIFF